MQILHNCNTFICDEVIPFTDASKNFSNNAPKN